MRALISGSQKAYGPRALRVVTLNVRRPSLLVSSRVTGTCVGWGLSTGYGGQRMNSPLTRRAQNREGKDVADSGGRAASKRDATP